jgi:hypothetical protein
MMHTPAESALGGYARPATAIPPAASRPSEDRIPLPLSLQVILITVFLPEGMSFFVGGLRLTVTRVLFLALAPLVLTKFAHKIATGRYVFIASDIFVPLASVWMFVGPIVTAGLGDSLAHSGPVVLEFLIAYFASRVLLTRDGQGLAFAAFMCTIICVVVLDATLDVLSGRYFTREVVGALTGYAKIFYLNGDEIRFGLLRAAGPLEHPILYGFACMIGLLTSFWVKVPGRPLCIAICATGLLISFSSAPLQSALTGFALLAYGRLTSTIRHRWLLISSVAAIGAATVLLTVPSPFGHLIEAVTLDPATGYYRLFIWSLVGPLALDNPYFGVNPIEIDAVYSGTIDSVWLVLAVTYGMPASIFVGLSMIGACSRPTSGLRTRLAPQDARFGTVLGIIMFLIILAGATVHFWGSIWILIGLLTGVRAHLGEIGALNLH